MGGRRWFSDIYSVNLSLDASRVGGKDLLVAELLGAKGGEHKAMWCPPQVFALVLFVKNAIHESVSEHLILEKFFARCSFDFPLCANVLCCFDFSKKILERFFARCSIRAPE